MKVSVVRAIVQIAILASLVGGGAFCLWSIATKDLSTRESSVYSVLLTFLSVLASWVITHWYSQAQYRSAIKEVQEQHRANLRTYALKAAEKVNNLSSQLDKLSAYLQDELDFTDYQTPIDELNAKEERIESAVHMLGALKSFNDTALSDWEGVIGDELDEQREEQAEREQKLDEVISRVEELARNQQGTGALAGELSKVKDELRLALVRIGGISPRARAVHRKSVRYAEATCPACGGPLVFKQRAVSWPKGRHCPKCGAALVTRYDEASDGFLVDIRRSEPVTLPCPECKAPASVMLDCLPGASVISQCRGCSANSRIFRKRDGVTASVIHDEAQPEPDMSVVTPEIMRAVEGELPAQPWPDGTHKAVATKLGLPPKTVRAAISELIRQGRFRIQRGGVLYAPVNPSDVNPHPSDGNLLAGKANPTNPVASKPVPDAPESPPGGARGGPASPGDSAGGT